MSDEILKLIQTQAPITAHQIAEITGLGRSMTHRHLKRLIQEEQIIKKGTPPKVYYLPASLQRFDEGLFKTNQQNILSQHWLTITPDGTRLQGPQGFIHWCQQRDLDPQKAILQYQDILQKYEAHRKEGFIDALEKLQTTFDDDLQLDKAWYLDFFAYEIFGKTRLGQLVLQAKLTQDSKLLGELLEAIGEPIHKLIQTHSIEAVSFIPHSIKRERPLLPFLQKKLHLPLPYVPLIKITGDIPIAQKTLQKTSERIENARSTIFIDPQYQGPQTFKNILLIDDAVGSGATLQESARKIKDHKLSDKVYGLALVGSLKGFEVISEV